MRRPAVVPITTLVAGLVAASTAPPAGAHDLWLQPSTFQPAPGELVEVALRIGHAETGGEPLARNDRNIEELAVLGPEGAEPVPGVHGRHPAGWIRPEAPGSYLVVMRGRPLVSILPAQAFERYLAEEGLDAVAEARARRGQSDHSGRERYSRALKALVTLGEGDGSDAAGPVDRPVGLPLELVARQAPHALQPGEPLTVELLHHGEALAGALVEARPLPHAAGVPVAETGSAAALQARSDATGRVVFRLPAAGPWVITAVHMEPAPAGAAQDWHSVWTALTFSLGGG